MEQLQQALKHKAHTAMDLLHKGILQTEAKLEQCLQAMQAVQEQVQQDRHTRACIIQDGYNAKLQELTEAFENQVLVLQQRTQAELAEIQTDAEAALQQAAAVLLQELQLGHDVATQLRLHPGSGVTTHDLSSLGLADMTAGPPMDAELTMASLRHAYCSSAGEQQTQRQTSPEQVHNRANASESTGRVDPNIGFEEQCRDASKDANSHNAFMGNSRSATSAGSAPYAQKSVAPGMSPAHCEQGTTQRHAVAAGMEVVAEKDSCCLPDVGNPCVFMQQFAQPFPQEQHQQWEPLQQRPSLAHQHESGRASTQLLTQPVQHHKPQGTWYQTGSESCHGSAADQGYSRTGCYGRLDTGSSSRCMSTPDNNVFLVSASTAPSSNVQPKCCQSPEVVGTTLVQQQCSKAIPGGDGKDSQQMSTCVEQPGGAQDTCSSYGAMSAGQHQLQDQVQSPGRSSCAVPHVVADSRVGSQRDTNAASIRRLSSSSSRSSFVKPMLQQAVPASFVTWHQHGAEVKNADTTTAAADFTGRQWVKQQSPQASRRLSAHSSLQVRQGPGHHQATRSLRKCVSSTEGGSVAVLKQASSLRHQLEASWQHGLAAAAGKANDASAHELSSQVWCVERLRGGSPRRSSLAAGGELSSDDDEAKADQPGRQGQQQSRAIKWFSISQRSPGAQRVDSGGVNLAGPGRYKPAADREGCAMEHGLMAGCKTAPIISRQSSMRVLSRHGSARKCSTAALELLN